MELSLTESRLTGAEDMADDEATKPSLTRLNTLSSTDLASTSTLSAATSSAEWLSPSGVLIFVDWDDTLCPTTWLQSKPKFRAWKAGHCRAEDVLGEADSAVLADLDQAARAFLLSAAQLGEVCCVTLARQPWQADSMEAFLPRTAAAWKELGIKVCYASAERVETRRSSPEFNGVCGCVETALYDKEEFCMAQSAAATLRKQRAMCRALRRFYGRHGSWKNVLSFGDSHHERQALWDAAFEHENPTSSRVGAPKPFRVKTMKMMEDPSCRELCEELRQLQAWLPLMVRLDRDFDETLESNEEARLDAQLRLEGDEGDAAPLCA